MCKYCKLKSLDNEFGEKENDDIVIGSIKDGSQVFRMYLNRYVIESENEHHNALVLELIVKHDRTYVDICGKEIKIKYCPFCGEKF